MLGKSSTPPEKHEIFGDVRLKPALVPSPLWERSVCKTLGSKSKEWRSIREKVINSLAGNCQYCGAHYDKGMVCHEVWDYDDSKHIATLIAFTLVCQDCDSVLHLGLTIKLGRQQEAKGKRDASVDRIDSAIAHLKKTNGISDEVARVVIRRAFEQHTERSKHKWQIRIAPHLIAEYPVLANLKL